jgi:hypothetical protein
MAAKTEKLDILVVDKVLNDQCHVLYQVKGIMSLATQAIREQPSAQDIASAWAALDAAYELLDSTILKLSDVSTLFAVEDAPSAD